MYAKAGALAILAALFSACTTTLTSIPVTREAKVAKGVVYTLPKQVFDIEARFLVTACSRSDATTDLKYRLAGASITPKLVPDAAETYSFRYEDLSSAMKVTAASVLWHPNGMLKSVNADVDDRSSQVISSVAATTLKLYTASVVPFAGLSVGLTDTTKCGPFIDDLLTEKTKLESTSIPSARRADEALTKARKAHSEVRVKLLVAREQLDAAKKIDDKSEVARLTGVVREFEAQEKVAKEALGKDQLLLPALEEQMSNVTNSLTAVVNVVGWDVLDSSAATPRGDKTEYCTDVQALQQGYWSELVAKAKDQVTHKPLSSKYFLANACVLVSNLAPGPAASAPNVGAAPSVAPANAAPVGLYYRQPSVGAVYVKDSNDPDRRFYASGLVTLPQFGTKAVLSLENQVFDKNSVKVQFNEDGSLSQFAFEQQSQGERLAASAESVSGTVLELMKLRAEAATAKAKAQDDAAKKEQQKQIDALDHQIALAGKRATLETAQAPAKDDLDKQKELLKKQIELEELRQQYEELLKKRSQ